MFLLFKFFCSFFNLDSSSSSTTSGILITKRSFPDFSGINYQKQVTKNRQ
uniref:Uncharacterized protein n=1 Tax=Podoviridae sp. ctJDl18 TaxID=2825242 RepID=A0A8S5V0N2_9CAUD|nr:MAG TPA: hypothetical protein [Podoviridae sp. ctJDl18]